MRGRRKIYGTAEELEEAVIAYFDSISRVEKIRVPRPTTKKDEYGHTVMKLTTVKDADGKPLKQRVYYVPPTRVGLTLFIGVSLDTWGHYGKDKNLSDVVAWAEEQIYFWEDTELKTRGNNRTAGLINSMDRNERARMSRQDPAQGNGTGMEGLSDAQLLAMAEQIDS